MELVKPFLSERLNYEFRCNPLGHPKDHSSDVVISRWVLSFMHRDGRVHLYAKLNEFIVF